MKEQVMPFKQSHIEKLSATLKPLLDHYLITLSLSQSMEICITTRETEKWLHTIIAELLDTQHKGYFIYQECGTSYLYIQSIPEMRTFLFADSEEQTAVPFYNKLIIMVKEYILSKIQCELEPLKTHGFWGSMAAKISEDRRSLLKTGQRLVKDKHSLHKLINYHQELYGQIWRETEKHKREKLTLSRILRNTEAKRLELAAEQQRIKIQQQRLDLQEKIAKSLGPLLLEYIVRDLYIDEHASSFKISTFYTPIITALQRLFKLETYDHPLESKVTTNEIGNCHTLKFTHCNSEFFVAFNQQEESKPPKEKRLLMLARASLMEVISELGQNKSLKQQVCKRSFRFQTGKSEEQLIGEAEDINECVRYFTRYMTMCKRPSQQDIKGVTLTSTAHAHN